MKKIKVKFNGRSYIVRANDSCEAINKVVKQRDAKEYKYRHAIIEEVAPGVFMIDGFGESYKSLEEAKKGVDYWIKEGIRFNDSKKINDRSADVKKTAEYLWTWRDANSMDFNFWYDSDEDYDKAKKAIDNYYEKLKVVVNQMLKDGYEAQIARIKEAAGK
jgi:hypothetical protein